MSSTRPKTSPSGDSATGDGLKKYRDRPADEGKHGDAAEEPNAGLPYPAREAPGRSKSGGTTQPESPELDDKS